MASGRKPGCAEVGAGIYVLAKNNSEPGALCLGPGAVPVGGDHRAATDRPLPGRAALAARFPGLCRDPPGPRYPGHSASSLGSRVWTKVPGVHFFSS